MVRTPFKMQLDRLFGTSTRERPRRPRGFTSEHVRHVEQLEGRALLAMVTVHVGSNFFNPDPVTVHPGDTVRWVFDQGVHSTTSVDGLSESWDSGVITAEGTTFDHTFNNLGTFAYYCTVHGFDQGNGTAGGMASAVIVKNDSPLRAINVTPAFTSLLQGATQQYTATGVFADGSTENLTNRVSWASTRPAVATITSSGRATAVSKGADGIIARFNDKAGVAILAVRAPAPAFLGAQRVTAGQGRKQKVIGVDLKFSGPLNVPMAQMAAHYQITQPGQGRRPQPVQIPVIFAQYNASTTTVRLTLGKFKANKPLSLTATGLLSASGTPLAPIVTLL